jgi:hypothetical protein
MLKVMDARTGGLVEVAALDDGRPVRIAVRGGDTRAAEVAALVERLLTYEGADVRRGVDAAEADLIVGDLDDGQAPALVPGPVGGRADDTNSPAAALRRAATHYREPLELGEAELGDAERRLERLRGQLDELRAGGPAPEPSDVCHLELATADQLEERFLTAIHDDLDTPAALGVLEEVAAGQGDAAGLHPGRAAAMVSRWAAMLGLDLG